MEKIYTSYALTKSCEHLSQHIPHSTLIPLKTSRFNSGEWYIGGFYKPSEALDKSSEALYKTTPLLVAAITHHDDLAEALFTIHELSQHTRVDVFLTYSMYMRSKASATWLVNMLRASGAQHIYFLDPHIKLLTSSHITNLSTAALCAKHIQKHFDIKDLVIVAPDAGAQDYAQNIANYIGAATYFISKKRAESSIEVHGKNPEFLLGKTAILVDDMLDSGATLHAASQFLNNHGASRIHAYITHMLNHNYAPPPWLANITTTNSLQRNCKTQSINISDIFMKSLPIFVKQAEQRLDVTTQGVV